MKLITIVLISLSTLLMLSTVICGAWLKSKGADPEGIAFHLKIAIPTLLLSAATVIFLIMRVMKG
jgi:hypothetical protein